MKRLLIVCILMLVATTATAARQEKQLICHVGNELGPNGEVYLDDPGCVPIEENDYFCPDAGKIDLINVAKPSNHLEKPSHAFGGISDYRPVDVGASGEGKEDSDGDGIDDGCQPACPCWTASLLTELTPPDLANADNNIPRACVNGLNLIENFTGGHTDAFQIYAAKIGGVGECGVFKTGSWSNIALPRGDHLGLTDAEVANCRDFVIDHAQSYAQPGIWDCWSQ